jgi:hypothetical protein
MEILNSYTNSMGKEFPIRNIHFSDVINLNSLLAQSNCSSDIYFMSNCVTERGVWIYASPIDSTRAFRIYKDFQDNNVGHFYDLKLISELKLRQPNVKLTEFPTGIITDQSKIIGQEIPFYRGYITLEKFISNGHMFKHDMYLKILKIIRELLANQIIYTDIHKNNFLIDVITDDIKLIDFDDSYICFYDSRANYESMLCNLKLLTNYSQIERSLSI